MSFPDYFLTWLENPSQRCLLAEVGVKTGGSETTRYLSSIGFVSEPGDTPANKGITRRPGRVSRSRVCSIYPVAAATFHPETSSWTTQTARWTRGCPTYGRCVRSSSGWGRRRGKSRKFVQVFIGTVEDIAPKDRYHLSLKLRDVLAPLNGPISTAVVGGTEDNKSMLLSARARRGIQRRAVAASINRIAGLSCEP